MNARAVAIRVGRPARTGLRAVYWATMTTLSAVIVWNSLPFFTFATDLPFLLEKASAYRDPLWRVSFYLHVAGGSVCLLAALPQFSRRLLRSAPAVHRALGWSYVVSVLGFVVPAGLCLALYAKGGPPARVGFVVLGVATLYATARGLAQARRRDFRGHGAWMIRSYALVASAISFRLLFIGLDALRVDAAYVLGVWSSLFLNLLLAELVIGLRRQGVRP